PTAWMRVCLTRKLAERIDGVDLSCHHVGESFDVPESEGRLLLAARWAVLDRLSLDRGARHRRSQRGSSHQNSPRSRRSAPAAAAQAAPSSDALAVGAGRPPTGLPDGGGSKGPEGV